MSIQDSITHVIDSKQITFFKYEREDVPIVYANMPMESGQAILAACEKLKCRPFHFVSITGLRWDEELSPWPHQPVVTKDDHFTGEANQYIRCLTEQILPFAEHDIQPPHRILAGYSMGGLFTLYAPYVTNLFSGAVSASGSVWYPEFVSYVKSHDFLQNPRAIYLSIGDLECRTKNQFLSQTENCMKELCSYYQEKAIASTLEQNPGNHYQDAPYRIAKGITWTLHSFFPQPPRALPSSPPTPEETRS